MNLDILLIISICLLIILIISLVVLIKKLKKRKPKGWTQQDDNKFNDLEKRFNKLKEDYRNGYMPYAIYCTYIDELVEDINDYINTI